MMLHQEHQFIYNHRTAIELPNGMCLDYGYEVEGKDDFHLISPDGSFKLVIEFFSTTKNSQKFLEEIFEETTSRIATEPIHEIKTAKGVTGCTTIYETSYEVYEECAFDLGGPEHALLDVWTMRFKDRPYNEELCKRAVAEVLASIQLINQN